MNNMMLPFVTALALGRNKKLTNQESMKAAVMGYVGSSMPGNAGAILSTMSAVNEEALKNKLEASETGRTTAQTGQDQAESDLNVLLQGDLLVQINAFANNGKPEGERVKEVLKRLGKWTAPVITTPAAAPASVVVTSTPPSTTKGGTP